MKTRRYDTRWIALMALFIAIQLFLNLSGIGLIPLPVIKGTTLHIPVIVAFFSGSQGALRPTRRRRWPRRW